MLSPPRRPHLALLIAITGLGPLALNILVPSMPGLQREFACGYDTIQLALSLFLMGFAIAQLVYGPASDYFGRRPVLLVGLGIFLVGTTLCALSTNVELLVAGRILQALGGCAGVVMGRAMVRDHYGKEKAVSALAYVTMAMVIAPMLAPTIGGFLDTWMGWRAGFIFVLCCGGIVLAAIIFFLSETYTGEKEKSYSAAYVVSLVRLLRMPSFCGYAFNVGFTSSVFFAFLGGSPYIMVELLGRPTSEFGLYFIVVSGFYMSGNWLAGRYSIVLGANFMITLGCFLAVIACASLYGVTIYGLLSPGIMFSAMGVIALGNGLSMPNGISAGVSADSRYIGAASGLIGFLQMTIGAGTSFLVGSLVSESATPMAVVMLSASVLAAVAFGIAVRSRYNANSI